MIKKEYAFTDAGFTRLQPFLSATTCKQLLLKIQHHLNKMKARHGCSDVEYFAAVNRWPAAALLDSHDLSMLVALLQPLVHNHLNIPLIPYEIDILYKSDIANLATPCHQDIAYAFKRPYFASTWIALDNVNLDDSPLEFLPGSHLSPIFPAIDFWQPEFVDQCRASLQWQNNSKVTLAACGDVILFSSRLWHASLLHKSLQPRIVIVIRWGHDDILYPPIPLPKTVLFGMWNCGAYTATLLKKGFNLIAKQEINDVIALIKAWQRVLRQNSVPFDCDSDKSIQALERLRILHEAYNDYKGSDGQGIVYASVWHALLKYLNVYLERLT